MKFKLGNLVWLVLQIGWILQSAPPDLFGICFLGSSSSSPAHGVAMAMSQYFSFGPSSDSFFSIFDISTLPSSEGYYGANATLGKSNTVWLIPDPNTSPALSRSGTRVVSKQPIPFLDDTGAIVSFDTSFSFQIITQSNLSGEGMAFFIAQDKAFPHASAGGYLGLSNDTFINSTSPGHNFFAVEFDIAQSPEFDDPSSSHIGININSLQSIQTFDTSGDNNELSLHQNSRFQTWITFNASTNMVQVWLRNYGNRTDYANSLDRTSEYLILQTSIDPSLFTDTSMWVGITATSGSLGEFEGDTRPSGYAIYSCYFQTFNENGVDNIYPSHSPSYQTINSPRTSLSYNLNNYGHPPVSKKRNFGLILGIFLSLLFLMVIMGFSIIVYRNGCGALRCISRPKKSELYAAHEAASADIQQFSYNVLKRATNNFSPKTLLGEGGFSQVYKGMLPNVECPTSRQLVAIKKLKENVKEGGEASFASEVRIISSIRHRNLLRLKGWCYEKGKALLVYEYADNGSLEKLLYAKDKIEGSSLVLTSERRRKILVGVATALEYLHEGLGGCVIHRDVKAANVLLNKDWEPMLGDFGLARLVSRDKLGATMMAAGTMGYIAPELVYTGRATEKADVYSFGILALEIACGRRVLDFNLGPEEMNLLDWVWTLHMNDNLMDSLDPGMLQFDAHGINDEFEKAMMMWKGVIHVALNCCHPEAECRPSMRNVRHILIEGHLLPLPVSRSDRPILNHGPQYTLESTSNVPTWNSNSSSFSTSL